MKKINLISIVIIGFAISACQATVKTPEVELEGPGGTKVTIEGEGDNDGNGKFCPPGQAKKNNC